MSELAERARKLANEFVSWAATDTPMDDLAEQHISLVIEQALLAERRFSMEEAAKIADELAADEKQNIADLPYNSAGHGMAIGAQDAAVEIAERLRAAAEKEVGK